MHEELNKGVGQCSAAQFSAMPICFYLLDTISSREPISHFFLVKVKIIRIKKVNNNDCLEFYFVKTNKDKAV